MRVCKGESLWRGKSGIARTLVREGRVPGWEGVRFKSDAAVRCRSDESMEAQRRWRRRNLKATRSFGHFSRSTLILQRSIRVDSQRDRELRREISRRRTRPKSAIIEEMWHLGREAMQGWAERQGRSGRNEKFVNNLRCVAKVKKTPLAYETRRYARS